MRHPTRPEVLHIGSRNTLLNLDTSAGHQNPQTLTLLNIFEMPCNVLLRKDIPPTDSLTPTDLWTALQDSWCKLPPGLLQTLIESIPRFVSSLLRARWGPTRY
ncbi:uncharacterized protein TNCV_4597841 [Trichonephila clavipes]|nr:uncharacterized protein TNCV_4597841 [Trichonephila clavipes]